MFDVSSGIKAQHRSGAQPKDAYAIMRKVVVQFAKRGYAVKWTEEAPPARLRAHLTDTDGTDLTAEMTIVDEGTTTRCDVNIHGHVFLGGLLGRMVSASTIKSRAQDKIKEMLDESFAGTPSKRSPLAPPSTPASAPTASAPTASAPHASAPHASAPHASAPDASAPKHAPTARTHEPWQALARDALSGARTIDARALVTSAAAAGAALATFEGLAPVHVALVRVLAKQKGLALDDAAAERLLARIGASPSSLAELASGATGPLKSTLAAFALTAAVAEAAVTALESALESASTTAGVDEHLKDLFEATYERVLGEKVAAHGGASALAEKLAQLSDARDAELLDDTELVALRERVLAS